MPIFGVAQPIDRLPDFRVVEQIEPDAPIEIFGLLAAVVPDLEQLEHAERRFQIFVAEKHIDPIASADLAHEIGNAVAAPHRWSCRGRWVRRARALRRRADRPPSRGSDRPCRPRRRRHSGVAFPRGRGRRRAAAPFLAPRRQAAGLRSSLRGRASVAYASTNSQSRASRASACPPRVWTTISPLHPSATFCSISARAPVVFSNAATPSRQ